MVIMWFVARLPRLMILFCRVVCAVYIYHLGTAKEAQWLWNSNGVGTGS